MFPLRDSAKPERAPVVNWLLVLANAAVFLYLAYALPDLESQQGFAERFGLVPARVRHAFRHPGLLLDTPWQFLREGVFPFFTAMFLHGGVAHLVSNLWFLMIFGDNVEGRLGHQRYLGFYLLCGVLASVLHIVSIPPAGVTQDLRGYFVVSRNVALDVPMVGASGAIAGVLGAYVVFFPRSRVLTFLPPFFLFEVRALLYLGFWFLWQFVSARHESLMTKGGVGVAYWAHVGGFFAGLLLALFAPPGVRRGRAARHGG
jgi:membrane associated rhomboid family serine protease